MTSRTIITLTGGSPGGLAEDRFGGTVQTFSTAIPEPASMALMLGALPVLVFGLMLGAGRPREDSRPAPAAVDEIEGPGIRPVAAPHSRLAPIGGARCHVMPVIGPNHPGMPLHATANDLTAMRRSPGESRRRGSGWSGRYCIDGPRSRCTRSGGELSRLGRFDDRCSWSLAWRNWRENVSRGGREECEGYVELPPGQDAGREISQAWGPRICSLATP